jgi:hypothetical protein
MTGGARQTLGAQATGASLFPVAAWLGVHTRRAMNKYSLIAVRALTDIAVCLLLGLTLVTLVWLTDAMHMAPTEVAVVHEALRVLGNYAELTQWWWIGLYLLMAGASVLFARVCRQPRRQPVEASLSLLSPRQDTGYPKGSHFDDQTR